MNAPDALRRSVLLAPWVRSKSPSAQGSPSTATFRWKSPSTSWTAAVSSSSKTRAIHIHQGSTIFIPKNHWHGFANPDHELLLLWLVSPAGLDGFFRETCSPPGAPRKQFTRDQIHEIALKYGTKSL